MSKKQILDRVGGLSKPSKMPGYAWSIPAKMCVTGSKLAKVDGSVCYKCYALKGRYSFPKVQAAMQRRLDIYNADNVAWINNMAEAIDITDTPYFRWFDSGDLQSVRMLYDIVKVAYLTDGVKHWLPTKEHGMVSRYLRDHDTLPANLTIRLSSPMIDEHTDYSLSKIDGVTMSSVSTDKSRVSCPAYTQDGKCGDCRACWNRNVHRVIYPKH